MQSLRYFLLLAIGLLAVGPAAAQPKRGDEAPEFPLGLFSDGKQYQLSDFRGKVVVLFFYESGCPRCKGLIPERNAVVKAFEGKPVKFIAIGASDTLGSVLSYGSETKLQMPIFADSLGLMEARYGTKLSLNNIYQFRVVDPEGKIAAYDMQKESIEKVLGKAAWKYDPKEYDSKLKPVLEAIEWNQWEAGMKLLAPLRRSGVKPVAESANKFYDALKADAESWKAEADKLAEGDPIQAYDLYGKLTTYFPTEPAFKSAADARRKLSTNKAVAAELSARKAFAQLSAGIAAATPTQRALVLQQTQAFVKKHGGTPTAEKVAALGKELEK